MATKDDSASAPGKLSVATRSGLLRELNEQAVLETIFREGPITRPELASRTKLSRPAVSAVVSRLRGAGLVPGAGGAARARRASGARGGRGVGLGGGRAGGGGGKKPMAYVVSDRAGFVVGIDIGGA